MKLRRIVPRLKALPGRITRTSSWRDPGATANARGYGYRWQCERAEYLRLHPLCVHCKSLGITTAATVVDHVIPHRGCMVLFWDQRNWQALCKPCHDGWKAKIEANHNG